MTPTERTNAALATYVRHELAEQDPREPYSSSENDVDWDNSLAIGCDENFCPCCGWNLMQCDCDREGQ